MADPPRRKKRPLKPGVHAPGQVRTVATDGQLRNLFRDANILQREEQGKLVKTVEHEGEFNVILDGETDYVRTVVHVFRSQDKVEHARTHCYQRRDGSIAASGMLDPKRVLWNGVLYFKD